MKCNCSYHIKRRQDFEKQMADLSAIINEDGNNNQEVKDLITWCQLEFFKISHKYPGDYFVVGIINHFAAQGISLEISIQETYNYFRLNYKLKN